MVVSEDVEKPDGLAIADDHDDGNHNQRKNDGGNVSSLRRGAHASAFGADRRIGGGEIATRNDNLLKGGTPSSTTVVGRERRSLRSHDGGSRSKSELALYFQNYEQILSLEPVKPGEFSFDLFFLFDLPYIFIFIFSFLCDLSLLCFCYAVL